MSILVAQAVTKEKHEFVSKIFQKSGISLTRTAVPATIQPTLCDQPSTDLNASQAECKLVYGQVISNVLKKTGKPLDSWVCCATQHSKLLLVLLTAGSILQTADCNEPQQPP